MIDSRDFYDKGLSFWNDGCYYRWSCAIKDSEKPGPNGEDAVRPSPDKKTIRASTIYNCAKIFRDSDSKINVITISQLDFKMKVPKTLTDTLMPKTIKSSYDNIIKYYNLNQKQL